MRNLDVDEGGAQYLPFALTLTARLHKWLGLIGLDFGKRNYKTPDGSGDIYIRTIRAKKYKARSIVEHVDDEYDTDVWQDHIRIVSGGGGYILQPQLNATVPAAYRNAAEPFTGNKKLTALPSYSSISNAPWFGLGKRLTSAFVSFPTGAGAWLNGKFASFYDAASPAGAFIHQYIVSETGLPATKTLEVRGSSTFRLIDSATGTDLISSGATMPTTFTDNYAVSADGRTLVVEFERGAAMDLKRFRLDIDFASPTPVVVTQLTDAAPYGNNVVFTVDVLDQVALPAGYTGGGAHTVTALLATNVTNNVNSATYKLTQGVSAAGAVVATTVTVATTLTRNSVLTYSRPSSTDGGDAGSDPDPGLAVSQVIQFTQVSESTVSITLPNGNTKAFTVARDNATVEETLAATLFETSSGGPFTADIDATSGTETVVRDLITAGTVGIIYSDPSVPVCIYQYDYTTAHVEATNTGEWGDGFVNPTTNGLTRQEVGILVGTTQRTLFTDSVAYSNNYSASLSDPRPLVFGSYDTDSVTSTVDTSTPITTNPGYTKKLKSVDDPKTAPLILEPAGWKILRDVNQMATVPTTLTANNYFVVAKDTRDWVLGVSKVRDPGGNVINTFDTYAGTLSESKLKQHVLDYLIAAYNNPTQTAILNNLEASGERLYLSNQSRLSFY